MDDSEHRVALDHHCSAASGKKGLPAVITCISLNDPAHRALGFFNLASGQPGSSLASNITERTLKTTASPSGASLKEPLVDEGFGRNLPDRRSRDGVRSESHQECAQGLFPRASQGSQWYVQSRLVREIDVLTRCSSSDQQRPMGPEWNRNERDCGIDIQVRSPASSEPEQTMLTMPTVPLTFRMSCRCSIEG